MPTMTPWCWMHLTMEVNIPEGEGVISSRASFTHVRAIVDDKHRDLLFYGDWRRGQQPLTQRSAEQSCKRARNMHWLQPVKPSVFVIHLKYALVQLFLFVLNFRIFPPILVILLIFLNM